MTDRGMGDVCTSVHMCGYAWTCVRLCAHRRVCMYAQCTRTRTHVCLPAHAHTSLPSAPQESPADVTASPGSGSSQSSAGPGARASRKPPNLSADRDRKAKCFLPTIIKKPELLKLPRAGGCASLGKDDPLPRGGAFESTPWTAAHRRLRAASNPKGKAQNTSLSQIQAGELLKQTLHSSYPLAQSQPRGQGGGAW